MKKHKFKCLGLMFIAITLTSCGIFSPSNTDNNNNSDDNDENKSITSISFDIESYSLIGYQSVVPTLLDNNGDQLDTSLYTLESNNTTIVSIDGDTISGNNIEGTATITATYLENTNITASCNVSVANVTLVESISVSADDIYLKEGENSIFYYDISPSSDDAYNTIKYYVEDESVAYIDGIRVYGVKAGTTRIVFETTANKETIYAYINIYVYNTEDGLELTSTTDIDASLTYHEKHQTNGTGGIPSVTTEDVTNVLVVPIEFTNYTFSGYYGKSDDELKDHLDIAFNGEGKEETGYWESVGSYYYKSSNGKLNLKFEIGDVVRSKYSSTEVKNLGTSTNARINPVMQEVLDEYDAKGFDFYKFDNDDDGELDGIWFIYSAPYDTSGSYPFWAYVGTVSSLYINNDADRPALNKYGWASFRFLNYRTNANWFETHTYIHETGHMLGLDDYYDTAYNRSPLGIYDMQDHAQGDQNAWTKAAMGWIDPYVYDVSASQVDKVRVTIKKDQPLFITNEYHDSVFDEFIIFELYTPDGLNEHDVNNRYYNYAGGFAAMPNTTGIKVLHSDSRLYDRYDNQITSDYRDKSYLQFLTSNYSSYATHDFISMISSKVGGGSFLTSYTAWTASDLFYQGDVFNLYDYRVGNTVDDSGKLNNGSSLDVDITIEELGSDYATLSIEKI